MTIYAAADLHGQLPDVPEDCDVLLLAGDICPDFADRTGFQQAGWLDATFRSWIRPLVLSPRRIKVIAIWGNHDFVGEHPGLIPDDLPWTLLQDSEATVNGLRIYGTPWVPGLPYWAFFANERALEARAEAIPAGLDILMTHGPPYGAGDLVPWTPKYATKYGTPPEGERVGDYALRAAIKDVRPKHVLCGHIHEDRGQHSVAGVPVTNVAAVDERYRMHQQPFFRL